ncbi:MAG TPA: hypothetical protein VMU50_23355, partial [Polyangia bacterium]|nr:hypothetical protein [Polyangia bacterium]
MATTALTMETATPEPEAAAAPRFEPLISLNAGWWARSSVGLAAPPGQALGAALSKPAGERGVGDRGARARSTIDGIELAGFIPVDLPATILGALVGAGEIIDPYYGANLRKIPGQGPPAKNFSNFPMPEDSPFRHAWWFRKELSLPAGFAPGMYASLQFDGINYRANVWFNGRLIAGREHVAGAYREFELDVTPFVRRDGPNAIAVEVFPPEPCDLALTWVDWNPSPPDKNTG